MAICNAIGSNTYIILICLGLPWTIKRVILGEKIMFNTTTMYITVGMLTVWSVIFYLCFLITQFMLNHCVGWIFLILYMIFVVVSSYIELTYSPKRCDIESPKQIIKNQQINLWMIGGIEIVAIRKLIEIVN